MAVIKELIGDFQFILSYRREKMRSQLALNEKAPKTGDPAPDFTLRDVSGDRCVTLSDFQGVKPVALVFGSFT